MMQIPWSESLGIVVLVYSDRILKTFAATCRCETALESSLCGLGYPEKPEKYTDFYLYLSWPFVTILRVPSESNIRLYWRFNICTTRQPRFLGTHDCLHAVFFFEHRYFESESAIITICIHWSLKLLKNKNTITPLWRDRAREIDGLPGATLAEIFVAYSMASVLYSSSWMKLIQFT